MPSRISKRKIKEYIKFCEKKLEKLEKEGQLLFEENMKQDIFKYDLTDHYLNEENYRGQIKAAYYILNNC